MADAATQSATAPTIGVAFVGDIVTVRIGPEEKPYKLHKDVLCYHSEYFRAAFNGNWQESEDGVTLEDVESSVFDIFVYWIYKDRFPGAAIELSDIAGSTLKGSDRVRESGSLLLKACVFGDRFLAPRFKQAASNLFVNTKNTPAYYAYIHEAFENLEGDDVLLKFLVDLQCLTWNPNDDKADEVLQRELLPPSFLVKVMIKYAELRESPASWQGIDLCSYHYHESDEERVACPHNEKKMVR